MNPGDTVGKSRVLQLLGRGGMAEVYLAATSGPAGFEKKVALKVPLSHLAQDPKVVAMLLDEARLSAQLTHRNIAGVLELTQHEGRPVITMEYVRGASLATLEAALTGGLPVHLAIFIASELASGLHYAHDARGAGGEALSIVHRDVSPSNVLLSSDGDVKLVDFGIAKAAHRTAHTVNNLLKGKLLYMAPEQANLKEVTPRSDQYSLGVLLFEMCTGRPLVEGEHDLEILDRVRAPDAAALNDAGLPSDVEALLREMLAREPEDRLPDLGVARERMADILADLEVREDACRLELAQLITVHAAPETVTHVAPTRALSRPEATSKASLVVWMATVVLGVALGLFVVRSAPPTPQVGDGNVSVVLPAWTSTGQRDLETLGPSLLSESLLRSHRVQPVLWYRYQETQGAPQMPEGFRLEADIHSAGDTVTVRARLIGSDQQIAHRWEVQGLRVQFPALVGRLGRDVVAVFGESIQEREVRSLELAALFQQGKDNIRRDRIRAFQKFQELTRRTPEDPEPYLWAGTVAWWYGPSSESWLAALIEAGGEVDGLQHVVEA